VERVKHSDCEKDSRQGEPAGGGWKQEGVDKQGNSGAEAFSRESLRLFWANRVLPRGRLNSSQHTVKWNEHLG